MNLEHSKTKYNNIILTAQHLTRSLEVVPGEKRRKCRTILSIYLPTQLQATTTALPATCLAAMPWRGNPLSDLWGNLLHASFKQMLYCII